MYRADKACIKELILTSRLMKNYSLAIMMYIICEYLKTLIERAMINFIVTNHSRYGLI